MIDPEIAVILGFLVQAADPSNAAAAPALLESARTTLERATQPRLEAKDVSKDVVVAGIPGSVYVWRNAAEEPVATLDEHGNLGLLGNVYQNGPMSVKQLQEQK